MDSEITAVKVKHNKAPYDKVTAEIIKAIGPTGMQRIYRNVRNVWQSNALQDKMEQGSDNTNI